MGICVGAHSRLAREIRQEPRRAEPDNVYVEILIPVTDTILPFDIPTSVMGRPRSYWSSP